MASPILCTSWSLPGTIQQSSSLQCHDLMMRRCFHGDVETHQCSSLPTETSLGFHQLQCLKVDINPSSESMQELTDKNTQ